jgi:D-serine deaminase-like pyridoxal phosphate-dependent protein
MRIEDLDTPALILYLDGLEDNLNRYQRYFDEHGIGLRPHIKTHKCLAIAHMQMQKGAMGITCQKLGEVEVMVAGGITGDVLVPYNIVGSQKLERLASLARQVRMNVAVDSEYTVRGLAETAQREGVEIGVVVELGGGRTGVTSAQAAVDLGKIIDAATGLELRGLMAMPTPPEARTRICETLDLFDREGLPHPIVSGGCTANALQAHEIPELTEYRAGEYCVGGAAHLLRGTHTVEQCALRVLTTVVSRPTPERAILDAGSKGLSASTMQVEGKSSMGYIVEYPEAHFGGASEEHGHIDVSACTPRPQIGERVQVLPVHPCPCVNEYDEIAVVQEGRVEAMWPVHARGKSR